MIFPFTFNFSVPGILNPFSKVSPSLSPPVPYSSRALAGSADDNKHSRIHQSPTVDSCQHNSAPNSRSQGALGYRDSTPAPPYPSSSTSAPYNTHYRRVSRAQLPKIERRPSPSPSTSASTSNTLRALPLSRKRGWEPTFGAESLQSLSPPAGRGKTDSTTSLTLLSSSGYLDTPAKYRDMAGDITMGDDAYIEGERREAEEDAPPPLKKRRGLAGSIVSTAVSAALIGTAVGLTVYRLWRDRGKEHQAQLTHPSSSSLHHHQHADGASTPGSDSDPQVPPPPYDPGAWKPPVQHQQQPMMAPTLPTPRSKNRRVKRPVGHSSASGSVRRAARPPRVRPEFDFGRERGVGLGIGSDAGASASAGQEEGGGVEDKMDWIGDKLSMLIEQGRRALQSEVVVMSEAKEDEVDDGRGGWEEDEEDDEGEGERRSLLVSRNGSTKSRSRAGSVRKTRPRNIVPPPPPLPSTSQSQSYPYSGSISASPRMSTFPSTSSASASVSVSASAYATPSTATSYTSATASGTTSGGFTPSASLSASLSSYSVKVAGGHGHVRGLSYESALPPPPSSPSSNLISASVGTPSRSMGREDSEVWESPELRESMERARARALARRAGVGAGGPV